MCEERLQRERELWEAIPWVPDLQCGWQVLLQCAGPRCHHLLRTLVGTRMFSGFCSRHAPDGSPHCNASNAAGRTGAQGGNPKGHRSFLGLLGRGASHDRQAPPCFVLDACSGQCFRRVGPKRFRRTTNMGRVARGARDILFLLSAPNPVSESMAGSTTRLPLPITTFGRRWYLLSRALLTRLTCALILAQLLARCYTEL